MNRRFDYWLETRPACRGFLWVFLSLHGHWINTPRWYIQSHMRYGCGTPCDELVMANTLTGLLLYHVLMCADHSIISDWLNLECLVININNAYCSRAFLRTCKIAHVYRESLLIAAEWRIHASINKPSLVQLTACRLDGAKPLSEPMLEKM